MRFRFWRFIGQPFLSKKSHLNCIACGCLISLNDFVGSRRLKCPRCGADLMLALKYDWLYTAICFAVGFILAYLQGLRNPLFLVCGLAYSGALVVIAAPILAPFFPVMLKRAPDDYVQTLRIP